MRYLLGSMIISVGLVFVAVVIMNATGVKATDNTLKYLGIAWAVLSIVMYPLAKKIMR